MTRTVRFAPLGVALATSCGGSAPEAHRAAESAGSTGAAADRPPSKGLASARFRDEHAAAGRPTVTAAIGGLPPDEVARTFERAGGRLERCFSQGVRRLEFLGGQLKFWVKVDSKGKFMHAHLQRSDLGDRETERCLLDQLMGQQWPTPVGGDVGVATFSMSFEPSPDARQPSTWGPERVQQVVRSISEGVEDCRSGLPGEFTATVYVEKAIVEPEPPEEGGEERERTKGAGPAEAREIGRALAASATPPDEAGEMVVDCLVKLLLAAEWPSPGDRPAKAVFRL